MTISDVGQDTKHRLVNWLASLTPAKQTYTKLRGWLIRLPITVSAAQSNRRHDVFKQHIGKWVLSIIQVQQSHK